jgi:hypothetical protein
LEKASESERKWESRKWERTAKWLEEEQKKRITAAGNRRRNGKRSERG